MTFKLELISTTDNSIIETISADTFKEIIILLDNNDERISEFLDEGNKKLNIDYNDINIMSISKEDLTYSLDFKNLINKIDLSLLNFSSFSLILQEYILNKNNIYTLLDKYNNLKIPSIALIKFKNGKGYSVDDLIVDGYTNIDVSLKIINGKIIVDLVNEENTIRQSSSYSLDEIDEVIFMEFNKYFIFELNYKSTDYV